MSFKELIKTSSPVNKTGDFIFESLEINNYDDKTYRKNVLIGSKPLKFFSNLQELEDFISQNWHDLRNSDAAIAGYISYEGEADIALYESLKDNSSAFSKNQSEEMDISSDYNFSLIEPCPQEFINNVIKCQKYIEEGDIYQANITRKFIVNASKKNQQLSNKDLLDLSNKLYQRLRYLNPAPYAGFMNFNKHIILSSSPESFLKFHNRINANNNKMFISNSPIKGTADLQQGRNFLINSEKDKAEHIMIVDLERNDIGKLSKTGTVSVDDMLGIYKFKNLYHYISTITGELKDEYYQNGLKIKQIFDACFPCGSITGAPKIRAMEVIKELEPCPRKAYTGSMGYFKFKEMQGEFNILIRSIIIDKKTGEISFHAGGGITANSNPELELKETNLKAEKLMKVFNNEIT